MFYGQTYGICMNMIHVLIVLTGCAAIQFCRMPAVAHDVLVHNRLIALTVGIEVHPLSTM